MHLVFSDTVGMCAYLFLVLKLPPFLQVRVGPPLTSNPGTRLEKSRWARVGVLGPQPRGWGV
jgi:hypothetical protein